jgi:putative FmdB family regulatory protein
MPTYEYECEKCGHLFEVVQPISAKALKQCTKELCGQKRWGKGRVKRAIGAGAGLLFKGSGFYITDYRSDNYHKGAKAEKSGASSGSSSAAESSKPAAKTETKPAPKPVK